MTIAKLGEGYQIVVPKEVREALGLKPGDGLDVQIVDGKLTLSALS